MTQLIRLYEQTRRAAKACPHLTLMLGLGAMAAGFIPAEVYAALPTDMGDALPDSVAAAAGADADAFTLTAHVAELVVRAVAVLLGIAAFIGPLAAILTGFRNRKAGDDREFHGTVISSVVVMVLGLGIALTIITFSDGIANQILGGGGA